MLHEQLSERIIACAIEVHRQLGPGLPERDYQAAFAIEFRYQGLSFSREPSLPVFYRGVRIGQYRPDFIVDRLIVMEIKAVDRYNPVFATQVLTYLRLTKLEIGLLFNFNRPTLRDGVKRFILSQSVVQHGALGLKGSTR